MRQLMRRGCGAAWLALIAMLGGVDVRPAIAAISGLVDYDIVYVRQPRFGDTINTTWPEVSHPASIDPGADLMLLHPDGSEELLVAGGVGSVTDPFVSFDGEWVYYSLFYDMRPQAINSQRKMPYQGADIFRIHLATRTIEQLTFGEFTPNTGAGNFDESDPVNPGSAYDRLGYGIVNLAPAPVAGGKIAFTSNRNGFIPPRGHTHPTMQLFVMDWDGSNVTQIAPMNIGSTLHPTPLSDGRLMFSTLETQGLRDFRQWGIWAIQPDGRYWEPIVSAFRPAQAFHFTTQLSNTDIVVVDYYNLNNNGFGALYRLPLLPPPGEPAFHSAFPAENPPIQQTVGAGFSYPFQMPFTPRGMFSITPFTHGNDEAAPIGGDGVRVGKFTHPSAAPNNDLLTVWTPGPANDLNRPTTDPRYDAGIYLIVGGAIVNDKSELILIKNDPNYNEAWPRAVVTYQAVHGIPEPLELPWLPNDGSVHPALPAGTPYGLVGTSSFYKRESFPGSVTSWSNFFDGLDAFNTTENGQSSNWGTQGSDAGRYDNSDIWAVRLVAMEPNTHRSYGPNGGPSGGQLFFSHAMERLRILGEIPLRKYDANGNPVLDPEGNPDTSFLAKIPANTPFTFQTLDRNGMVLNIAQTWHQLRPGEMRADCGGCHAHSQQPLPFDTTAASQADYPVVDLTFETPLLSRDADGAPSLRFEPTSLVNVEFYRDIRPLLIRSCVPCHTQSDPNPPGDLVLDDYTTYGRVPGDYARLADDSSANWGYPPLVGYAGNPLWRQTNASRYVRRFQSRRSLLMWKIFGQRLDGWNNQDHPTETVPGDPQTLPSGASINQADLDFTGQMMPPPGSGVTPLSDDEKMTIARWIDLGAPINWGDDGATPWGWFLDEIRPTLAMSSPRPGYNVHALTAIRIGLADANTGIDPSSLSLRASFVVAGRPANSELADLAVDIGDGIYSIPVAPALTDATSETVYAEVADHQGNITRVARRFSIASGSTTPTATATAIASAAASATPSLPVPPTRTATPSPTASATATPTATFPPAETATATATATVPAAISIAGALHYVGSAIAIGDVDLIANGASTQRTRSDAAGSYGFDNLTPGNWTIAPSKSDPNNPAVGALDAAWALQASVGSRQLDRAQRIACDVTGNGTVSSFDAARILQKLVGRLDRFAVAETCGSDFFFTVGSRPAAMQLPVLSSGSCTPVTITYGDLHGSVANADFGGAVFGDCTLNAPRSVGLSRNRSSRLAAATAAPAVQLSAPLRSRRRYLRFPVRVTGVDSFEAVDLTLTYDADTLRLVRLRKAKNTGRSIVRSGDLAAGRSRVVLAAPHPVEIDAYPVLMLIFERVGRGRGKVAIASAVIDDQPARIDSPRIATRRRRSKAR